MRQVREAATAKEDQDNDEDNEKLLRPEPKHRNAALITLPPGVPRGKATVCRRPTRYRLVLLERVRHAGRPTDGDHAPRTPRLLGNGRSLRHRA